MEQRSRAWSTHRPERKAGSATSPHLVVRPGRRPKLLPVGRASRYPGTAKTTERQHRIRSITSSRSRQIGMSFASPTCQALDDCPPSILLLIAAGIVGSVGLGWLCWSLGSSWSPTPA